MRLSNHICFYLIGMIAFVVSACGESSAPKVTVEEKTINTRHLGEWRYIKNNKVITIDESSDTSMFVDIDNDLLQQNSESGAPTYLIREIKAINGQSKVSGSIVNLQNSKAPENDAIISQGEIDVGKVLQEEGQYGVEVVLEDIKGLLAPIITASGNNGEFNIQSIEKGRYTIIGRDRADPNSVYFEYDVDITGESQDIGISTIIEPDQSNKYNFKSVIGTSDPYVFADYQSRNASFTIQNISSERALGLHYKFDCSDPVILSCSFGNTLGTIEPGSTANIPFNIAFNFIDETKKQVTIPVQITDALGNQWTDYGVINVYRKPVRIGFRVDSIWHQSYLLISPENKIFSDKSSRGVASHIYVPYFQGEEYRLLVTSAYEAAYNLHVNHEGRSLDGFYETNIYEPNESYENAKHIQVGESITSYLHYGDLDYYRIDMPPEGINLTPYSFSFEAISQFYDWNNGTYGTVGNGDGKLNPGESAAFNLSLRNNGVSRAENIEFKFSTDDPFVTLGSKTGFISAISGLSIKDGYSRPPSDSYYLRNRASNPFKLTIADDPSAKGHEAIIQVLFQDGHGNQWEDSFKVAIE